MKERRIELQLQREMSALTAHLEGSTHFHHMTVDAVYREETIAATDVVFAVVADVRYEESSATLVASD